MMSVIANNLRFLKSSVKRSWQEAPLFLGLVIYFIILTNQWPLIAAGLAHFKLWLQIILLCIIPISLGYYQFRKEGQQKKKALLTFREPRILPKHYIEHFKGLLPDGQLDLFHEVLLPTLSIFYTTFDEIGQIGFFEEKYQQLYAGIKQLKSISTLYTNQHIYKYRDLCITAFAFYRILFKDAIEVYQNHLPASDLKTYSYDLEPFLLIKRVPAKLSRLLGGQYWRLFEFFDGVYGNPANLKLNQDVTEFLLKIDQYFQEPNKNPEENNQSDSKPIQELTKEKKENNVTDAEELFTKSAEIADKFKRWLEKKIKRHDPKYQLNTGGYVFYAPLIYGTSSVFITESLLNHYSSNCSISPSELKQALLSMNQEPYINYIVKQNEKNEQNKENEKNKENKENHGEQQIDIPVFKLDQITIEKTPLTTVTIKQVV